MNIPMYCAVTAISEMGQHLSVAGLGTKISPPVLERELYLKCYRSFDNVEALFDEKIDKYDR
jgi:hypothetical protein